MARQAATPMARRLKPYFRTSRSRVSPRAVSAAPAGWSTTTLAWAGIILISLPTRSSFEAGIRPALLHPFSNLPVSETAKPAVRRN